MHEKDRIRIDYTGDVFGCRVALITHDAEDKETAHDLPVEAFSIMATTGGTRVALVLGEMCFEVHASGNVDQEVAGKLKHVVESIRRERHRSNVVDWRAELRREIAYSEENAKLARAELLARFQDDGVDVEIAGKCPSCRKTIGHREAQAGHCKSCDASFDRPA